MSCRAFLLAFCVLSMSCDLILGIEETNAVPSERRDAVDRDAGGDAAEPESTGPVGGRAPDTAEPDAAGSRSDAGGGGIGGGMDSGTSGDDVGTDAGRDAGDGPTDVAVAMDDAGSDDDAGSASGCSPSYSDEEIALWLDAARGVIATDAGRIQEWTDLSRHGHRGLPVGEPDVWPVYVPDVVAGHAGVQFGVDAELGVRRIRVADHESLWFGTGDVALIAVLRHRNSTAPIALETQSDIGAIFLKLCDCIGYRGAALFANDSWSNFLGSGPTRSSFSFQIGSYATDVARSRAVGFNDNAIHVVAAARLGYELTVEVDGRPHAAQTVAEVRDLSNIGVPVTIGANHASEVQGLDGELFELIVITGNAARDVSDKVDCLLAKYDIP